MSTSNTRSDVKINIERAMYCYETHSIDDKELNCIHDSTLLDKNTKVGCCQKYLGKNKNRLTIETLSGEHNSIGFCINLNITVAASLK